MAKECDYDPDHIWHEQGSEGCLVDVADGAPRMDAETRRDATFEAWKVTKHQVYTDMEQRSLQADSPDATLRWAWNAAWAACSADRDAAVARAREEGFDRALAAVWAAATKIEGDDACGAIDYAVERVRQSEAARRRDGGGEGTDG
jgi:hypothetical protein